MTSTTALADALKLCAYQTPAFPCRADKKPACSHGFKDATADPDELKELWRMFPGPLVGVPTGEASGIFVVDIDSARHDEANDWLERYSPYLPDTRQHVTKSGGWHLLFKHRAGLKNSTSKLARGVDTRGDGGYIIWSPFHMGLTAPHKLDLPLTELPVAFGKHVGEPNIKVEGILAAVARAQEGERNRLLFWAACRITEMVNNREIGPAEGATSFHALSIVSVNAGLPGREVARTIRSAVQ
jgi:hypothetical protein